MSILDTGSYLPPGVTGNPYTPDDISKFFDLNWPAESGIVGQGFVTPGLGSLGLGGLGQSCISQDEAGNCIQYSSDPVTGIVIPVEGNTPVPPLTTTGSCPAGWEMSDGVCAQFSCPAGYAYGGGICTAPDAVSIAGKPNQTSYTPAQLAAIIAAGGNSAVSLIRTATGGPYTVAGTNLVYNPATGQLSSASTGITSGLNLSSISSYLPAIGLAIAAWLVISSLGKR